MFLQPFRVVEDEPFPHAGRSLAARLHAAEPALCFRCHRVPAPGLSAVDLSERCQNRRLLLRGLMSEDLRSQTVHCLDLEDSRCFRGEDRKTQIKTESLLLCRSNRDDGEKK